MFIYCHYYNYYLVVFNFDTVINSDLQREWVKLCKRDKYSDDSNDKRTKELIDFLKSNKSEENMGTYLTAVMFHSKPTNCDETYSGLLCYKIFLVKLLLIICDFFYISMELSGCHIIVFEQIKTKDYLFSYDSKQCINRIRQSIG